MEEKKKENLKSKIKDKALGFIKKQIGNPLGALAITTGIKMIGEWAKKKNNIRKAAKKQKKIMENFKKMERDAIKKRLDELGEDR